MDKDVIIGGASNYSWNQLKVWVNSIKKTGFKGDIIVVATNISADTIDKLTSEGVKVSAYGKQNEDGSFELKNSLAPHVERFFWIWNTLRATTGYRYAVVTDTRDVLFQTDPTPFLEQHCINRSLISSSEGLVYKDEPWGLQNITECFGPFFKELVADKMIYNVGTIAGRASHVSDLLLLIFQMSLNRPIAIVDQAVYNLLVNTHPFVDSILPTNNKDGWAVQLGTTIEAVKAGSGDIGKKVANDISNLIVYETTYKDVQPKIEGAKVLNPEGKPYVIVHQYDRIPSLYQEVMEEYGT